MMQYFYLLPALVAYVYAQSGAAPTSCLNTSTKSTTFTITDTITSTYCPVCDMAKTNGDVYTTTYATVFSSVCPTGLTPITYTVTQPCTGTTPIDTATCPPGYTTTAVECTACPHPTSATETSGYPTVVITIPCGECQTTAPASQSTTVYVASGSQVPTPSAPNSMAQFTGAASPNTIGASAFVAVGSVVFAMFAL